MKKVIFICRGNMHRSPVAEAFYNLLRKDDSFAESYGTMVEVEGITGKKISSYPDFVNLINEVKKYGADISNHICTQVNPKVLEEAGKIIVIAEEDAIPTWLRKYKYEKWDIKDLDDFLTPEILTKDVEIIKSKVESLFLSKTVISGSFRKHLNDIGIAMASFEKANTKVLAPLTKEATKEDGNFVFLATDDPQKSADILEKEFMANIEKADFLYLANVGGYVRQSAATEMGVALMNDVPIVVAEEMKDFSDGISKTAQELFKKSVFQQLPISEISSEKIAELNLQNFTPVNLSTDKTALLQSLVKKCISSDTYGTPHNHTTVCGFLIN